MATRRRKSRTKARRFKRKPIQPRTILSPMDAARLRIKEDLPPLFHEGKRVLRVQVEPGIGDFSWVYSKLVCLDIPLHVIMPETLRKRNAPLMDMLPNVVSWEHKSPEFDYHRFTPCVIGGLVFRDMNMEEFQKFIEERDYHIWMSLNYHLEQGCRLDEYFPACGTNYHYQINTPQTASETKEELVGSDPYLLIYPSSYKNNLGWSGWKQEEWCEFIRMFRETFGHIKVVLIGAEYDDDYESIFAIDDSVNLIGKTSLDVTIEIIRGSSYFIAFPSGLPILANVIKKPCWMFYPKHLEPMQWAWADPEDIESKTYMASQWCPPSEVVRWLKEEYKYDLPVL